MLHCGSFRSWTICSARTRPPRPKGAPSWLEQDRYYRWCVFLHLPVQYAGLALRCWLLAHGNPTLPDKLGLALTLGGVAGIGINTAHELGRKKESVEYTCPVCDYVYDERTGARGWGAYGDHQQSSGVALRAPTNRIAQPWGSRQSSGDFRR